MHCTASAGVAALAASAATHHIQAGISNFQDPQHVISVIPERTPDALQILSDIPVYLLVCRIAPMELTDILTSTSVTVLKTKLKTLLYREAFSF